MTKNKNKKSSEAAKQEAFKLSDGICYCKTPARPGECWEECLDDRQEFIRLDVVNEVQI